MSLLRDQFPFNRCTKKSDLINLESGGFVRIAGLVTCRQRPGTASGTMFLTIEDETGDMNVIVWSSTQEHFRRVILTSKLIVIKGTIEIATEYVSRPVIHIIAGHLADASAKLSELVLKSRNFHQVNDLLM
jgi:error-prone DNA polymerase